MLLAAHPLFHGRLLSILINSYLWELRAGGTIQATFEPVRVIENTCGRSCAAESLEDSEKKSTDSSRLL
jgi:hypothetical protein